MAAFVFETITAAQASAYDAAVDTLSFQTTGASGSAVSVAYLAGDQISISLAGQTVTFGAGILNETGITFSNASQLFIGGLGADQTLGTDQADGMFGGQGNDTLTGAAGDDLLQGNQGGDSLNGGAGNDTVYGGQGDDVIDVDAGANFGQGNLGADTVSAAATAGNSTLLGGQGDDRVIGGGGADFLNGNLGNDSIAGGAGDDFILGEAGSDTMDGGAGADTFTAAAGSSDVTLAGADQILGWSHEDRIDVAGSGGPAAYYQIPAATTGGDPYGMGDPYGYGSAGAGTTNAAPVAVPISFSQALSTSNSWLHNHPSNNISTAQIDTGVAVFVDSNGDHVADIAIILVGASIFDVSGENFI